MDNAPRLALPFRVARGRALVVEQDSDEDVRQCVEIVLRYRPGDRPERPEFGTPDQTHRQGGASLPEVAAAVARWEPRAEALATSDGIDLETLVQRVRVS